MGALRLNEEIDSRTNDPSAALPGRSVVRYDRRGTGYSDRSVTDFSMEVVFLSAESSPARKVQLAEAGVVPLAHQGRLFRPRTLTLLSYVAFRNAPVAP